MVANRSKSARAQSMASPTESRSADSPQTIIADKADVLAYVADIAIELAMLSAKRGYDALGAQFLEAAAAARRLRADSIHQEPGAPKDAPPEAT